MVNYTKCHWYYGYRCTVNVMVMMLLVGVCRQDVEVQQPWNVGLGVSMDMGNNNG